MPDDPEPVEAELVDPDVAQPVPPTGYDERGNPTLDHVRDRIESRYATSVGATELAEETVEARTLEQQEADRAAAARAKLDEIRRSMG